MKTVNYAQGSDLWLAHRRTVRNASDAPAMMGCSPYVTRSELVRQYATGITREIDEATQARFDRGHAVEPALRALAEQMLKEDLYPITAVSDDGYIGASFDGVSLGESIFLEAKQSNASKMAIVRQGRIPEVDKWQVVQQFAVCESAVRCIYMVGDGTSKGTVFTFIDREQVEDDISQLLAGWKQFDADVAAYVPEPQAAPAPAGKAPDALPALFIELRGEVTASNLADYRDRAIAVFKGISTELHTDEDFASAAKTVKFCADIEDRLKAAKDHALSQTQSIDELFRAIDAISAEARSKRLELEKLVSARKEAVRLEIAYAGRDAIIAHVASINATLGEHAFGVSASIGADINAAIKGLRSIQSIRDAVDGVVANAKIAASQKAEAIRANIAVIATHGCTHAGLFPDHVQLCATKSPDDLRNLIAARIAEHEKREAVRIEAERERIRQEELARIEQERLAAERAQDEADRAARVEADRQNLRRGGAVIQAADYGIPAPSIPATNAEYHAAVAQLVEQPPCSGQVAGSTPAGGSNARIKMAVIQEVIAPLTITEAGLAKLGFKCIGHERTSKLYAESDLPRILTLLSQRLADSARVVAKGIAA